MRLHSLPLPLPLFFFLSLHFSILSAEQADLHSRAHLPSASTIDPAHAFLQWARTSLQPNPHRILFSTHSASPWSRARRRWSSVAEFAPSDTNPSTQNQTGSVSADDNAGTGASHSDNAQCHGSQTVYDSVKKYFHGCKGDDNWVLRTILTVAWLILLFYLLGSTASDYFSCTLERLSNTLKLSPAVAGVTLLAIGNGAPDVFSSVAAFASSDSAGSIGFSCVLGGALFITTVVSGTVALVTGRDPKASSYERINLVCFVRDGVFLLASAAMLAAIIVDGKVVFWEAVSFLCVYGVYAVSVWAAQVLENRGKEDSSLQDPLLLKGMLGSSLPQWNSSSPSMDHHDHDHDHHHHLHSEELEAELEDLLVSEKDHPLAAKYERLVLWLFKNCIEWPLALPRRLTIPVIEEERWSRPLAVSSCTLAPLFVGAVWLLQCDVSMRFALVILAICVSLGVLLGTLAFFNTENTKPPEQFLWLWLGGGFIMSIVWFYLVADQVVQSLEALGVIFSINPAILGLTVLAWGNSIGDLVADLALACGGRDGVQIAISGCYAGPLFNMVIGLGVSLVIACWRSYPDPLVITDEDGSLFFIIGFLVVGLFWSLVMLPLNGMRLSKSFGCGLLLIYGSFLVAGMCYALGWISQ